jgi:hypothetical protein
MGNPLAAGVPCAKGPIPYCLDKCSSGEGARERLEKLRDAVKALSTVDYIGLEEVFRTHLLPLGFPNPAAQQSITDHLKKHWFDPTSREAFFKREERTTEKYAKGVIEAVERSLKARSSPVAINAWWVVDNPDVKLLTLAEVEDNYTISQNVTLLILTPRPPGDGEGARAILGNVAQAWVTELAKDGSVVTRQVQKRP